MRCQRCDKEFHDRDEKTILDNPDFFYELLCFCSKCYKRGVKKTVMIRLRNKITTLKIKWRFFKRKMHYKIIRVKAKWKRFKIRWRIYYYPVFKMNMYLWYRKYINEGHTFNYSLRRSHEEIIKALDYFIEE